ncbi:hypothetical protein KPSA1B_104505 [Pseudomonas syringae pv. actinidiae]|nr:hypothetical protein KPSA1B_104505 [Pseudomonas syringae pv. actinidiae]
MGHSTANVEINASLGSGISQVSKRLGMVYHIRNKMIIFNDHTSVPSQN